jgi:multidrug resistance efflux pump
MKRPVAVILLLAAVFAALLVWRLSRERARERAPAGGSATVEGTDTIIGARTAGRVQQVLVHEGDRVKKGEVLVHIDCRDNEAALALAEAQEQSAEAQVAVYEAQVGSAKDSVRVARAQAAAVRAQATVLRISKEQTARDLARTQALVQSGALPSTDLEHSDTQLQGLEKQIGVVKANTLAAELGAHASNANVKVVGASLGVAEAQVATAQADVERAKIAVSECTVTAPSDGVVTARLVEPGAVVGPGSRLLVTVAADPAKVIFFLPDAELSAAKIGAPATVKVDAYPHRVFHGVVSRVSEDAEFTPRNVQTREDRDRLVYEVEVHVPNHDNALRPGMPADVFLDGTGR